MELNRSLIKSQAKQLLKGKVWRLFVTMFVITLCMSAVSGALGGVTGASAGLNDDNNSNYNQYYGDRNNGYDSDYFNGFGSDEGNDFFDFTGRIAPTAITASSAASAVAGAVNSLSSILTILLGPLGITLSIFFVWFVRGNEYELGKGIEIIFKETFNNTYLKKLICLVLKNIITMALSCLFIVPGIIFYYSSYYTYELLCDYPELSGWEAIQLSKKMIRGHRTELFKLDLSFLGWYLLCIFIFPIIYVRPYTATTKALYYENFRLRALQIGELTEDDFLSEQQKFARYANSVAMNANPFGEQNPTAGSYTQPQQQFLPPQGGYYQPPVQQAQPQAPYYQPPVSQPQVAPQPQMPQQPPQPQGGFYQPPVQQAAPAQPTFTVAEPVAPQEPNYAEVIAPEEPVEAFTEPTEPTEPSDINE